MSDTTILLAQLMGPTLGLMGLGMLFNPKFYGRVFRAMGDEDFDMLLTPMVMIPVGVALVMSHWMWGSVAEVLVSLVGLGMLVKGGLFAILPQMFKGLVSKLMSGGIAIAGGIIWVVGGGYLTWVGFFM